MRIKETKESRKKFRKCFVSLSQIIVTITFTYQNNAVKLPVCKTNILAIHLMITKCVPHVKDRLQT